MSFIFLLDHPSVLVGQNNWFDISILWWNSCA